VEVNLRGNILSNFGSALNVGAHTSVTVRNGTIANFNRAQTSGTAILINPGASETLLAGLVIQGPSNLEKLINPGTPQVNALQYGIFPNPDLT
jgi:hypothetical protein